MYDWFALSLGLAASVRPASNTLAPFKPPQVLCKTKHYVLLVVTMAISFAMYWGCLAWLKAQPWFRESLGTSFQVSRCKAFFVVFLHWIGMSLFGCFWLCPLTCWRASHLHDAVSRQAKWQALCAIGSLDAYVLRSCTGSLCAWFQCCIYASPCAAALQGRCCYSACPASYALYVSVDAKSCTMPCL